MIRQTSLTALLLTLGITGSFALSPSVERRRSSTAIGGQPLDRKSFGAQILAVVPTLSLLPEIAKGDVSDGTMLPQGAQQFQKALRLKSDIPVSTYMDSLMTLFFRTRKECIHCVVAMLSCMQFALTNFILA